MPSKRQPAKQRRAAENRARRDALAARSEHAKEPTPVRSTKSSGSSSGSSRSRSSSSAVATSPITERSGLAGWFGLGRPRNEPGALAALCAVMFGLAAVIVSPLLPIVTVDDRGEPVPTSVGFEGLYIDARERLTGHEVTTETTSALDAIGPLALVTAIVPFLVVLVSIVMWRRTRRSLPLTVGMLALAVLVMMAGNVFFLGSMIALAVASFQVRKVEMAQRMAEQQAARADEEDGAADEDEDDEYEYVDEDEDYEDDEDVDEDEDYEDEDEDFEDEGDEVLEDELAEDEVLDDEESKPKQ